VNFVAHGDIYKHEKPSEAPEYTIIKKTTPATIGYTKK
jgi:hypothetical protein